jgi:hypothetical protein
MMQRGVYLGAMLLLAVLFLAWALVGCANICGGAHCNSYSAGWN